MIGNILDRMYEPFMAVTRSDHKEWTNKIPFIEWPVGFKVKAVPPFAGAVIRYFIVNTKGAEVSIYLDCYDCLGYFGEPYWEIYPAPNESTERFSMNDIDEMIEAVGRVEC